MKKAAKVFLTVAVLVVLSLCIAACSSGVTGTYRFSSITVRDGSTTIEIRAGEKYMGVIQLDADTYVLTMNDDNTFKMEADLGSKISQEGKWEERDGKYILSVEGESEVIEATINGKTLTFEQEGVKIILKK